MAVKSTLLYFTGPDVSLETGMSKLKYCTYVLYSQKDQKLYIGSTSNLKRRLTDHFRGKSKSTSFRRPFSLIFCEFFVVKSDALRREKYFKTTVGKKSLRLVARDTFKEMSKL